MSWKEEFKIQMERVVHFVTPVPDFFCGSRGDIDHNQDADGGLQIV